MGASTPFNGTDAEWWQLVSQSKDREIKKLKDVINGVREVYKKLIEVVPKNEDEMLDAFYQAMDNELIKLEDTK